MSATNRSEERQENDNYATPRWCVERFLEAFDLPDEGTILEPCAGNGAIIETVNRVEGGHTWQAVELRQECEPDLKRLGVSYQIGDFLSPSVGAVFAPFRPSGESLLTANAVITNPPYSLAKQFIEKCQTLTYGPVAMLLRLNFLASKGRQEFYANNMPDIYVLPDRPCFRISSKGSSSDACEYGWFVFYEEPRKAGKVYRLGLTPKAVLKAAKEELRACAR